MGSDHSAGHHSGKNQLKVLQVVRLPGINKDEIKFSFKDLYFLKCIVDPGINHILEPCVFKILLGFPGRPDGGVGLIPPNWVSDSVGGNGVLANLTASVLGSVMYFATLTEAPIVDLLIGNGMGKGPALALLLAGPALSAPSVLVIHSVLGWRKTIAFVALVVTMATITGVVYGAIAG